MRTIILVLAICFAVPAMAGDKCDALAPDPARDIDQRFKGEIEGKVKGIISRIAGAAAKIEGEYKRLEKDTLKDYPDSHKLYVWQKIIYLACIQPGRIDINRLLELYMNPPVKGDGRASRDDKDRVIATVRAMEWVESNCGRHIKLVIPYRAGGKTDMAGRIFAQALYASGVKPSPLPFNMPSVFVKNRQFSVDKFDGWIRSSRPPEGCLLAIVPAYVAARFPKPRCQLTLEDRPYSVVLPRNLHSEVREYWSLIFEKAESDPDFIRELNRSPVSLKVKAIGM